MPTYSQTLVNPGAELGNTSGWTLAYGNFVAQVSGSPASHSGGWKFKGATTSGGASWYQDITVDPTLYSAVDHGQVTADYRAWHICNTFLGVTTNGRIWIKFYSAEGALLDSVQNAYTQPLAYTQEQILKIVASGTRKIRIGCENDSSNATITSFYDDFTLDLVDSGVPSLATNAADYQSVTYGLVAQPAAQVLDEQTAVLAVSSAQTSGGNYKVFGEQFVGYALVKGFGDTRKLRAWTFTQDDHDFYVLQLNDSTLIYDKLTGEWARWQSPGYSYWRGDDGCGWEGFNVACDPHSGKIWKIDAQGRIDIDGTVHTPITSKVVGVLSVRFRRNVPCYMAELALSEGKPPTGVAAGGAYLQLRTSSDDGQSWVDHGNVLSTALGEDITVRWYGLGLMKAPGQVFEITDTGYARRLDGFNIEVPDNGQ